MQLRSTCSGDWLLFLSVFSGLIQVVECCQILCALQKPCFWVMPTWWPFWKRLLGIFKCLFLDHPHFSRTCIKSRLEAGEGVSHGTHSLPLFRIARMSVFTMFYILPSFSPGPLPLPLCYLPVWGVTLVFCFSLWFEFTSLWWQGGQWPCFYFLLAAVHLPRSSVILRLLPTSKDLFYCFIYGSLCEFMCAMCIQESSEIRRRYQIHSWNWSYNWRDYVSAGVWTWVLCKSRINS